MKDSYYFPHDYHARHDPKLEKLRMTMGCEGIGIFWCLVEMLYEENGYLNMNDIETFSKSLNAAVDKITNVIQDYGLFNIDSEKFYSEPLLKRLEHLTLKREKARESINRRWNTNVLRTNNEGNTRKESKVKESSIDLLTTIKTKSEYAVYQKLPLETEFGKMRAWLAGRPGRKLTKRFIINWLNKCLEDFVEQPANGSTFGQKKLVL